jgi:hypothetical protein
LIANDAQIEHHGSEREETERQGSLGCPDQT